jgi:hypothetical protein
LPEHSGSDSGPALASLDLIGDPAELRERVRREARVAAAAGPPPPVQEGADGTDSVRVALDSRGGPAAVELSRDWRDRLGPGDLPAALYDAYADAVRKVVTAAALARFGESSSPDVPAPGHPVAAPALDEESDERWLARTWAALDEVEGELYRLERLDAGAGVADRTVTGPAGLLSARVRGGTVVAVTGDAARIAAAGTDRLRHEAVAVLRAAVESPGGTR